MREYQESKFITERHLCALKARSYGICFGDSGGPLVLNDTNELIGIVSFGLPCADGVPDIFTRVSEYVGWIKNAIRRNQYGRLPDP